MGTVAHSSMRMYKYAMPTYLWVEYFEEEAAH